VADLFRQFSPDFFDLIIVDECHRGSASENSAWREVSTTSPRPPSSGSPRPRRRRPTSRRSHYFGEPVYTYSLKQGIEDGFLAPYKVVRIDLDKDLDGWRPREGEARQARRQIEDRIYNQRDFDRTLDPGERTKLVAKKVSEFLRQTDRYQDDRLLRGHRPRRAHAPRLVNENGDLRPRTAST
jgi:type I restriction enzyme R subunit